VALLDSNNLAFGFVLANATIVDVEIHHEPIWAAVPLRKFVLDYSFKRDGNAVCSLNPIIDRVECKFRRAGFVLTEAAANRGRPRMLRRLLQTAKHHSASAESP
jgi:hypothetical protein